MILRSKPLQSCYKAVTGRYKLELGRAGVLGTRLVGGILQVEGRDLFRMKIRASCGISVSFLPKMLWEHFQTTPIDLH